MVDICVDTVENLYYVQEVLFMNSNMLMGIVLILFAILMKLHYPESSFVFTAVMGFICAAITPVWETIKGIKNWINKRKNKKLNE
jgi:hypothetical protein